MNDLGTGMAELTSLFLIVLLIYILQGICWMPPRAFIFTLGLRGRGKRKHEGIVWNALDTAGTLANPFPPLTPLLAVQWPAFELTPDSIYFPGKQGDAVSIPWEKLKITHSETRLLCNGLRAFKGSEVQVLQYVELLGALQHSARAQRHEIIQDWMRKRMNMEVAARRVRVFFRRSRWLRLTANLQFVVLFLLAPWAFSQFGTAIVWRLILVLASISIAITIDFWILHKSLFLKAKDHRFKSALIMLFSPVAAIRACDVVARDLLSGYHPLAVAGVVLEPKEFRKFAGEQLRLCRFGDYFDKQYQDRLQKLIEQAIRKKEIDPKELMRPPEPQSGCVVYCPRCLAQYTKERAECSDCGYESLAALDRVAQKNPEKNKTGPQPPPAASSSVVPEDRRKARESQT